MQITSDEFLSRCLNYPVFNAVLEDHYDYYLSDHIMKFSNARCMLQCKIDSNITKKNLIVDQLQRGGFYYVTTNLMFDFPILKKDLEINISEEEQKLNLVEVSEHAAVLHRIIKSSFTHNRYYKDPIIGKENAQIIMSTWLDNLMYGGRASDVFISRVGKEISGYLYVMTSGRHAFIDLLAVDKRLRKLGSATNLVNMFTSKYTFLSSKYDTLKVGTLHIP